MSTTTPAPAKKLWHATDKGVFLAPDDVTDEMQYRDWLKRQYGNTDDIRIFRAADRREAEHLAAPTPPRLLHLAPENETVARDGNPHLVIPAYALATVRLPKHRHRVAALEDHRALKRVAPDVPRVIAIHHRDNHLHLAHQCKVFAALTRQDAQRTHGDAGQPMPTPISGGICDHWPEDAKNLVTAYVRLHQAHKDLALAWHRYAGKRRETFLALILAMAI